MKKQIFIISFILLSYISSRGQVNPVATPLVNIDTVIRHGVDNDAKSVWDRGSSFTPQNSIFNDIDLSSYELLSANLSFTDKDQTQKVVLAPFKLTNNPKKFGILVNTKINVSLKDKITTVGIGFGGDNSSPYTKRANRIRGHLFDHLPAAGVPDVTSPLTFEQQIVNLFAECKNIDPAKKRILDSMGISACIDPAALKTLDSLNNAKRLQIIFDAYNKKELARSNRILDSLLLLYDKRIAANVFKWTIGYNKQLFPSLFAQGKTNGFDSLNFYNSKADNITGSLTYSHDNNWLVVTATYNQIYSRSTAVKDQKVVPYYGPAFSVSLRLFKFLRQSVLDTSASYKKSLFVPSLNLGFSYEGKYGDGANKYKDFYQDKFKRTVVWTPFLDILISPVLQFRLAVPITRNTGIGDEKITAAGANIQYNFKLSNLSQ